MAPWPWKSGAAVYAYDVRLSQVRDISVVGIDVAGTSAPAPLHRDGWTIAGCPVNEPALDAADHLVAASYSATSENERVCAAFSENDGRRENFAGYGRRNAPWRPQNSPDRLAGSVETQVHETRDEIVVLSEPIDPETLRRLVAGTFVDMVKYVADVATGTIAIGGQLHVEAEQMLLERGSHQEDLWGANYYPGRGAGHCIEFTSMINIRPADGNHGMVVTDAAIQERIREITFALVGRGEPLP